VPKTVLTSATTYCAADVFIETHDARKVGDLLLDNGTRDADPESSTIVARALLWASGMVETACLKGARYTPTDLAALTGAGQSVLETLVADLAFWFLCKRRHKVAVKAKEIAGVEEAFEMLQWLAEGERIFSFQETADAGLPATETETPDQKDDRFGVATIAERYFGRVSRRMPIQ
jgi:hypothetical protein